MAVGGTVSPHFRHYKGAAGHGDESEIHLQAKAVIADWASRCVPEAVVAVERRSGARRPDVQVSSSAAGWTTAMEYQRSELPADVGRRSWAARQDALAREHDQVIWLLDPIMVTGHPSNPRGVVPSELMYAMARRGLPIRVLDIATNRVTSIVPWLQGVALLKRGRVHGGFIGTSARKHFIAFSHSLDVCRLVDGAMQTPIDRQLSDLGMTHRLEPTHDPKRAPAARQRRWEPVPHFR